MQRFARLSMIALTPATMAAATMVAAPASAQTYLVYDVPFFERVSVGNVDITPFGVVRDQRCADARFCFRPEDMRISVVMHDREYPYELVLKLGEPTEVPGGYLILHDPGTRPRQRGALRLSEYALDFEFIPAPHRGQRARSR